MHACLIPQSAERRHCGAASCAVMHTPARQYDPDEPSQQSASPAHGVRQTALTQARPVGHSDDERHPGRGPTSG